MSLIYNSPLRLSAIIVLVALSSFLLGGLAVHSFYNKDPVLGEFRITPLAIENPSAGKEARRVYASSSGGKRYYPWWCNAGSSISPKNIIWFSTPEEAIADGYSIAQGCL